MEEYRTERDTMGEMPVPASALYGAQTARAIENFPISGRGFPRPFLAALALVKKAAARVNGRMGFLPAARADAIAKAAAEVEDGRHDDQFPVDIYQTGSGTSTNMNANEVIGRLAGAHPNDDVNRGQSSNDVIPTAMHVAAAVAVAGRLLPAMQQLGDSLARKAAEFHGVMKIGRTHLQDAVPGPHGPGIQRLCAPGGGGGRAGGSGAFGNLRTAAGRHGGRHRVERTEGLRARGDCRNRRPDGAALHRSAQPLRSAGGARRSLFPERRPPQLRRGTDEDRE